MQSGQGVADRYLMRWPVEALGQGQEPEASRFRSRGGSSQALMRIKSVLGAVPRDNFGNRLPALKPLHAPPLPGSRQCPSPPSVKSRSSRNSPASSARSTARSRTTASDRSMEGGQKAAFD